jgi:ParB-like chromosome segregation protein Spo0J
MANKSSATIDNHKKSGSLVSGSKEGHKGDKVMNTATEHKTTNGPIASGLKFSEDEIKHIPLSDIEVDYDWNSRSKANVIQPDDRSDDKDSKGVEDIRLSILARGQDTPVVVAPIVGGITFAGKKSARPYQLVAGFVRFTAVEAINKDESLTKLAREEKRSTISNTGDGTIRAVVRGMDPREARSFNARENTARKGLALPDLVIRVRDMSQKDKLTTERIRCELGLSLSYVTALVAVGGINPKVLDHWRNGGKLDGEEYPNVQITKQDMIEVAKLKDPEAEMKAYKELLRPTAADPKAKEKQWIAAGKAKAETIGTMLGLLQRNEFLEVNADKDAWIEMVMRGVLKVTGKKKFTKAIGNQFGKAAMNAYNEALTAEEVEENGEEEEGDEE